MFGLNKADMESRENLRYHSKGRFLVSFKELKSLMEEDEAMKSSWIGAALLLVLLLSATLADAQMRADAYFGLGTARDSSNMQSVDLLGIGIPAPTSSMGGVFGTIGGGLMLKPQLGVGAELSFRFAQGSYAGLGYRPIFYDFNGIWMPIKSSKRLVPEVQAGFGGVNVRYYGGGAHSCDPYQRISSKIPTKWYDNIKQSLYIQR